MGAVWASQQPCRASLPGGNQRSLRNRGRQGVFFGMPTLIYCRTPGYNSWRNLIARCTNSRNPGWHRYGGRGIKVCSRWIDGFENFYADMGPPPASTSLDRIDNNGNYEPKNCRWATKKEQTGNRDMTSQRAVNADKTHCPHGHAYDGINIILQKKNNAVISRKCRTCHNEQESIRRSRRSL